jgi:hypothetical protein
VLNYVFGSAAKQTSLIFAAKVRIAVSSVTVKLGNLEENVTSVTISTINSV